MADTQAKKILAGLWADTGDRTDPDDAALTPPIVRANGYPASFSADSGDVPRRRVINQRFREFDGAVSDLYRYGGTQPYDDELDYFQFARCSVGLSEYAATIANGPSTGNATDPTTAGQTVWDLVTGEQALAAAPDAPSAVAGNGTLVWTWNCPLDGGSEIIRFDFQWRQSGGMFADVTTTIPRYEITGLSNGSAYEAQVRAVTAQGNGPYSTLGTGTPAATTPSGGNLLALRAEPGDAEASISWLEPDDGGSAITGYTYQWRTSGQSFSTARQGTTASTSATVSPLGNSTAYFFQVRATNAQGNSTWSNEDSATPVPAPVVPVPVPDTVPDQIATAPAGSPCGAGGVSWAWRTPDDGGPRIDSYELQWREQGIAWLGNVITTQTGGTTVTGLSSGTTYEARVRASNTVGTQSSWSPTGSADTDFGVSDYDSSMTRQNFLDGELNGTDAWAVTGPGVFVATVYAELDGSHPNFAIVFSTPVPPRITPTGQTRTDFISGKTVYADMVAVNPPSGSTVSLALSSTNVPSSVQNGIASLSVRRVY